ncbi:MAG: hypothetical protein Q9195_000997 [Heterodermia aff. obscurata]
MVGITAGSVLSYGFCFAFPFIVNGRFLLLKYRMEVSHPPRMPAALGFVPAGSPIGELDSMDIDMDIDLGPTEDEENARYVDGEVMIEILL